LKSCKTVGFSLALSGKAGILFVGLIIIDSIIGSKTILSRNRIKEKEIVQYLMEQPFFTKQIQDWKFSNGLPGWLVYLYRLGVVFRKTLN